MAITLTVDRAGRVVLPKPVRDEMQLAAGDCLELHATEHQITLRPIRKQAPIRKKSGVWVISSTGRSISVKDVNDLIGEARDERIRQNLGHSK